jgi:hypothetical protein
MVVHLDDIHEVRVRVPVDPKTFAQFHINIFNHTKLFPSVFEAILAKLKKSITMVTQDKTIDFPKNLTKTGGFSGSTHKNK